MKRVLIWLTIISLMFSVCSCKNKTESAYFDDNREKNSDLFALGENSEDHTEYSEDATDPEINIVYPEESRIRYICNLVTLECIYHNMAIGHVTPGDGLLHWTEEETEFWIEYDATATLGIDANEIRMEFRDNNVIVNMPHASIIGIINIDPDSISDPVYRPNSFFRNDVEISSSDISRAMASANTVIYEEILNDNALISSAEAQAENIIRNYINEVGELSGTHFNIEFIYR